MARATVITGVCFSAYDGRHHVDGDHAFSRLATGMIEVPYFVGQLYCSSSGISAARRRVPCLVVCRLPPPLH
jgi:hypothetical protein